MLRIAAALAFAAMLAAPSAMAQGGAASSALAQAVAATGAAKVPYGFDLEINSARASWRARFEPNATPRLRLVSPSRRDLSSGARRAFDSYAEDIEGVSWCASEYMGRVADVRQIRETETSITYAFQPTPESIRSAESRRYARYMRGEMTITKQDADITSIRIYSPEGFEPMPLVRLTHLNMTFNCARAPNGRHYAAEVTTEMRGSAFGQNFDDRTVQRASNLSAP